LFLLEKRAVSLHYQTAERHNQTNIFNMPDDKKPHRFKISDESLNTYGTWVQSKGVDLKAYKGNPVVLLGHRRMSDWRSREGKPEEVNLPIGKCTKVELIGTELWADLEFDLDDPVGKRIDAKIAGGFMSAVSIGFRVLQQDDRAEFMKPGQRSSTITKSQLVEISIVDIPANVNATNADVVLYALDDSTGELKALDQSGCMTLADGVKTVFLNDLNYTQSMKKVLNFLKLSEGATEDEVMELLEGIVKEADATKTELKGQRVAVLLAEYADKYTDAEKPTLQTLGAADYDGLKAFLEVKPKVTGGTTTPKPTAKTKSLAEELAAINSGKTGASGEAEYWASEKNEYRYLLKNKPTELERIQKHEAERFATLKAEYDADVREKRW
jgi:Caudovirus prohead serine protease